MKAATHDKTKLIEMNHTGQREGQHEASMYVSTAQLSKREKNLEETEPVLGISNEPNMTEAWDERRVISTEEDDAVIINESLNIVDPLKKFNYKGRDSYLLIQEGNGKTPYLETRPIEKNSSVSLISQNEEAQQIEHLAKYDEDSLALIVADDSTIAFM